MSVAHPGRALLFGLLCASCGDDGAATETTMETAAGSTSGSTSSGTSGSGEATSSSGTSEGSTTQSPTTSTTGDSTSGSTGGEPGDTGGLDEAPPIVDRKGVAYVVHFLSNDLRWYRVDGGGLAAGGSIDIGAFCHDATLDDVNDHLYVAHDVARTVDLYGLDVPTDAADPVDDPQLLSTIDFERAPRFVRVDPHRRRLYVIQDPSRTPSSTFDLLVFDVSDPADPQALDGSPWPVPATTSLDLDPIRGVLFIVGSVDDALYGFDVSFGGLEPLPGSPVDLLALYPQENQTAFQARGLVADPWTHRLYAGRAQGALSELIVLEYPEATNGPGEGYGAVASLADIAVVSDSFDVDTDIAERPGILSAYEPMPVRGESAVFLVADAWNGQAATATIAAMTGETGETGEALALAPGCGDHEGFGCFYRPAAGNSFLRTDGAACLDDTHGIVFGTALGAQEDEPGSVVAFTYDGQLTMAELSDPLTAGALPIEALCH